ncbi:hypothetical protein BUALT_Bualt01G0147600 [Buddleja alternifolia]|uniref:Protein kinase domain-containing protein n=1 Tax=Buddleja alternifolia TaxID=168488 RepID=A0AAV6YI09_9LAMI|nr:hypothetical protein BUALT_Bualt01G0147600 [Buddleja alternifolia]
MKIYLPARVVSMAKPSTFSFLLLLMSVLPYLSNQLQPSQHEALLRIEQQLNLPQHLKRWTENADFCNSEATQILTLACYQDNITQLQITSNNNYWSPNLGEHFSTPALFSNLATLTSLKVVSLVSLGLKGPLPSYIANLSSLEILNISSNSFQGSIPIEISTLRNLQTLILDHNSFSGEIPDWLSSLPALSVLSVKNNSFSGSLPNALSTMFTLRTLILSRNNLSGQVPPLDNLTNLQVLDLEDNNLGPHFPTLPTKLVSLVLKKNKFHSTISDKLSSCYQLQNLGISINELVGIFPPSLFSLPSLIYLDIGGNKFSGKLLKNMSCNAELKFVNISENRLTGDLPDCLNSNSKIVLFGGNCLSRRYKEQHPDAFCHSEALAVRIQPEQRGDDRRGNGKVVVASSMVGGGVGVVALVVLAFLFVKKHVNRVPHKNMSILDKVSPAAYTLQLLKDARYISETMKLGAVGNIPAAYRTFVVDELKEATNNFNTFNLIGEGSNGQVYKGCLTDGTVVAITSLKLKKRQSITHQLELVSKLRHPHLVSAIGHCYYQHATTIFLVFEYVPNGTLRTFISTSSGRQKLRWTERIGAGIGVAKGIQFLHTGIVPGLYSNHLKITDVLMDRDLHVKISKYNLPLFTHNRKKRLDEVEVVSHGSKENFGSIREEKNDVYDFGVILLEMIVGRTIITLNDINISKDILSVSLTTDEVGRRSIVDPAVHKECSDESLNTLIELCVRCLSNDPSERPSVEDIIWNLQFAAQVQDSWQPDTINNQDSPVTAMHPPH